MAMTERSFVLITTFIEVLALSDVLVTFVLAMTMTYLTDVWKKKMVYAGAIVNIFSGAMEILPIALQFFTFAHAGIQRLALASVFCYSAGLGLLAMSLPPVLAKHTGTCSDYKPECIGHAQKYLFYISLAIIAFAGAAYRSSLKPIATTEELEKMYNQAPEGMFEDDKTSCSSVCTFLIGFMTEIGLLVTVILLEVIKPWAPRYGTAAIVSSMGFVAFLCSGSCCSGDLFNRREAAVLMDRFGYKNMAPFWLSYIACGVVSSVGNTYFSEQANTMKSLKIGKLNLGYYFLLWISLKTNNLVTKIYRSCARHYKGSFGPTFMATGVSMAIAVLCCITAANVEARRLHRAASHGLIDKPEETIPMSVFWMLPQFMLLGAFDGLYQSSAQEFVLPRDFIDPVLRPYAKLLNKAVFGVGIIGSSLSVFAVGRISERVGSKRNWFQSAINQSRLDNYYWVLATYSAVNLLFYIGVASFYARILSSLRAWRNRTR